MSDFVEIGFSGLRQFSGYLEEELLPLLRGDRALDAFREMRDNDPIIGSAVLAITGVVRKSKWQVVPHPDDPEGDGSRLVEFVESCRHDMSYSWSDTISMILDPMITYGWSFHEIVYKRREGLVDGDFTSGRSSQFDDGLVGWRKLADRPADSRERWEFDEEGGIAGMWQRPWSGGGTVFIPVGKSLLFRTTASRNSPEGRSMLRSAFRPYFYKKQLERSEAIGVERDLAGLPVMYAPNRVVNPSAQGSDLATRVMLERIVRGVRRGEHEGVLLPGQRDDHGEREFEMELLSSGGRRQHDTSSIIVRYDQRMAMSFLTDFLLLGHERIGTQALSLSKIELFKAAMESLLNVIAETFNRYAVPRLLAINGMATNHPPRLSHSSLSEQDVTQVASFLRTMHDAGMPLFPDDELESWLREKVGAPMAPEDRDLPVLPVDVDDDDEG